MECEFKWNMTDRETFLEIVSNEFIAPLVQSSDNVEMDATYYDTFDQQIARAHGGLRIRRENGEGVVCLKLAATTEYDGALKEREEYECYAPDIRSGMLNLPAYGAPQDFCDKVLKSDLMELGHTEFLRQAYQLAGTGFLCELAFDEGRITHRGRQTPICELELELKGGDKEAFEAFALELQKKFALVPQPLSKLARMLRL